MQFCATEKIQLQFCTQSYSCKRNQKIQMWIRSSKREMRIAQEEILFCFRAFGTSISWKEVTVL